MSRATFRFYEELNDFLPEASRKVPVAFEFVVAPSVKDAIEALGVPHVEVDLIVVGDRSVGFDHRVSEGDRIAVYPVFESLDISPIVRLRPEPLRRTAFIADVHLRKLSRLLRLLGLDTLHSNDFDDAQIVAIAAQESRIILTRDRQLLKHGAVTHGYWVRSTDPIEQAREILRRFDLGSQAQPFSRCLSCNGLLSPVEKEDVLERIPPKTAAWLDEFHECGSCRKLYWRGTHAKKLEALVDRVCSGTQKNDESPPEE
ncbi:MAG: Mut7-C RNAse domain-containing protein, partial [Candidatus Bipolaricaulia bacterium]